MRLFALLPHLGKGVRRALALAVVPACLVVVLPGVAAADPPERFTESDTVVDEFLSELCGAEITFSFTLRETTMFFEEGSEVPHQHIVKFSATITGPGGSLIVREVTRQYETGETSTVIGLPFRILSPDGGVVIQDAGYVLFTFGEEDPTVVHGPHPVLLGEFDVGSLCAYLV